MPILWSEPNLDDERLIKIFFLTLNAEEQALLIPYNINFPTQPKPLLEYTSFITSITKDLYFGIRDLPSIFEKGEISYGLRDAILISLIKMFLRTGKSLRYLYLEDIDCSHFKFNDTTITTVDLVLPSKVSSESKRKLATRSGFKRKSVISSEKIVTVDGLIENLKENSTLTTVNFVSIQMGIKRMKKLIKVYYKSTVLNSLGVHYFPLCNKSGKLLATYLKRNITMTSLHLTGNKNIKNIGKTLGNQLAEVLCENRTLKSLKIQYYYLQPEVGKVFSKALEKNNVLTSLDLGFNNIGSQGGIELANALKYNTTLTSLNLSRNRIGPEGGLALAEALCINTSLTILDVCENHIGGGPTQLTQSIESITKLPKALGDALCMNTTLTWLDIGRNNLGKKVGEALGDALYKNISLKYLNLQKNSLGPDAGRAIKEALYQNVTLTDLNLLSNGIEFEVFFRRNPSKFKHMIIDNNW
ncbi:hypothetical protein C2G38_2143976 [Gigaspora rosea]|uniref:Uncharacterized protein n=1 Tax=Gigaspora rosea TaxID=44941 RepID=A0A397UZ04_9GLOM|nr:hypothetical protein C2G38_2143976 [Gigaspora rosea]